MSKVAALILINFKCIEIRKALDKVETYDEYLKLGLVHDKLQGKDRWKANKASHLYDWERIESRLENM